MSSSFATLQFGGAVGGHQNRNGSSIIARMCQNCNEAIPPKRLEAVPNAKLCVPCLEKSGDVPKLRRYDEAASDGDTVQTYFTDNKQIRSQITRNNRRAADDESFYIAAGDDAHLVREYAQVLDIARSLASVVEHEIEVAPAAVAVA